MNERTGMVRFPGALGSQLAARLELTRQDVSPHAGVGGRGKRLAGWRGLSRRLCGLGVHRHPLGDDRYCPIVAVTTLGIVGADSANNRFYFINCCFMDFCLTDGQIHDPTE